MYLGTFSSLLEIFKYLSDGILSMFIFHCPIPLLNFSVFFAAKD